MDNQTAKSIDRSLKSIASSLQKIEKNTRPTIVVPEPEESVRSITGTISEQLQKETQRLSGWTGISESISRR
ncbi:hypothetical protein CSV63_02935 [Sporosarcina sp. P34]|uniref:hypothetical protein n=1 Tax=Sporosarcina sp. P34 TaxID=2048247 RepID=UPI000C167173|nr:hypothetical protein [Sporosarcina sp. P34]PID16860.1 hypothetical protein CSV63_02935 [Sporosarcina sp. P34]